jgi:hypothetical protein
MRKTEYRMISIRSTENDIEIIGALVAIPWQGLWHSNVNRSKRLLEAAHAAPYSWGHRLNGRSSPQAEWIQALVLLFLLLDVFPYY